MDGAVETKAADKFVQVDGLRIRYLEEGSGPAVIVLHGSSLGSSADVWRRNLGPLSKAGVRVIAPDQPGFGLSDDPPGDWGGAYRRNNILKFMDAMGLEKAALIGHSAAGNFAVDLAISHPDRISKVIILGTGSLLPPLPEGESKPKGGKPEPVEGQEGGDTEPTLADSRKILENNLFNHDLITDEELKLRHSVSLGKNLRAFLARNRAAAESKAKDKGKAGTPGWQKLDQIKQPLLLIFGREDRGQCAKRFPLAQARYPKIEMHLVPNCKHLVQWDAADEFHRLAVPFLRGK
jgi:pimeloyl-ACP methyl ester carboxylesterase